MLSIWLNRSRKRIFLEVAEFTGVKKSAKAGSTAFVLDVKLILVDHRNHVLFTFRAFDIPHPSVLFTHLLVANIDRLRSYRFSPNLLFQACQTRDPGSRYSDQIQPL
ncbi:MAG: hypothetical protein ACI8Z1_000992 [Candidatus Azotimanducaceae bacterium]